MSTPNAAVGFMLRHMRAQAPPRGWQNGRMSASGPTGSDDPREVLSSLPRSRRQRPTARREAARAERARAAAPAAPKPAKKPKTAAKAKPAAKAAATTKPTAGRAKATAARPARKPAAKAPARTATKAAVRPRPAKRAIPPAGYATPRTQGEHGSADPGAALAGLVRSILKLIPRP